MVRSQQNKKQECYPLPALKIKNVFIFPSVFYIKLRHIIILSLPSNMDQSLPHISGSPENKTILSCRNIRLMHMLNIKLNFSY